MFGLEGITIIQLSLLIYGISQKLETSEIIQKNYYFHARERYEINTYFQKLEVQNIGNI